jgi:hypothetical protein
MMRTGKSKGRCERGREKNYHNKKQGTKPSHKVNDYEGLFNNPGYGTIEFFSKADFIVFPF